MPETKARIDRINEKLALINDKLLRRAHVPPTSRSSPGTPRPPNSSTTLPLDRQRGVIDTVATVTIHRQKSRVAGSTRRRSPSTGSERPAMPVTNWHSLCSWCDVRLCHLPQFGQEILVGDPFRKVVSSSAVMRCADNNM